MHCTNTVFFSKHGLRILVRLQSVILQKVKGRGTYFLEFIINLLVYIFLLLPLNRDRTPYNRKFTLIAHHMSILHANYFFPWNDPLARIPFPCGGAEARVIF